MFSTPRFIALRSFVYAFVRVCACVAVNRTRVYKGGGGGGGGGNAASAHLVSLSVSHDLLTRHVIFDMMHIYCMLCCLYVERNRKTCQG